MKRIGIDVGGTFTDLILIDENDGTTLTVKVPTRPSDPAEAALDGIRRLLTDAGASAATIGFVGHGTTIATNLLIEGKGSPTALITTEGFRDILEIRRSSRHDRADLYDLQFANPEPLVPRRFRYEAPERVRHDGAVERPLSADEATALAERIAAAPVEAVAVCFLNAHARPDHERVMVEALRDRLPDRFSCASFEVNPEMMEYERTSTTVVNAMLGPKCGQYIRQFERRVRAEGVPGEVQFMQSNGGLTRPSVVADRPVRLLESGPAGGVTASTKLCAELGFANAILGDMGGTTFDVSLIRDGRPEMRTSGLVQTYTVRAPTIDIESVGAGGGSIAWVDEAGGLRIGPESAGAMPGPACYGRGGTRPTVTDCNLVLGYLDEASFSQAFALDRQAAERAIETHVAGPLGCDVVEAAHTVRAVANAHMAAAIRLMTVERGYDPREFIYLCFGGAGPVHASELARELDIPTIVVPPFPGLFSALGMLVADQSHEVQRPMSTALQETTAETLRRDFDALADEALSLFPPSVRGVSFRRRIDCRYVGQAESITLELPDSAESPEDIRTLFEVAHKRLWNFLLPEKPILLVNLRLIALAPTGIAPMPRPQGLTVAASAAPSPYRRRKIAVDRVWLDVPAYLRDALPAGAEIAGPAVVEEASSSLFFAAGERLRVHANGSLIVQRQV